MTTEIPDEITDPIAEQRAIERRQAEALTRIANVLMWSLVIAVSVAGLWLFSDVLLLLFAATLISCQLRGAARQISEHVHIRYGIALTIIVLLIGSAVAAISYWRGPAVVSELQIVYDQINDEISRFWQHFGQADWLQGVVERVKSYLGNKTSVLAGSAAGFVTSGIGNLGSLLLILVAAVYLAASPTLYERGLVRLLPKPWRPRAAAVLREEGRTLRRWFLGQLLDMIAIGVMTGVGLWALGVPLAPTLGLIAALCNFVPYIGAIGGSVPAIIVAFGQSPQTALWVTLLFITVQTIEGNLISPLISRRTVDLPPVLTLFSQTVLGTLFGPLGLVLATPITAATVLLVRMVYVEAILGDDV